MEKIIYKKAKSERNEVDALKLHCKALMSNFDSLKEINEVLLSRLCAIEEIIRGCPRSPAMSLYATAAFPLIKDILNGKSDC